MVGEQWSVVGGFRNGLGQNIILAESICRQPMGELEKSEQGEMVIYQTGNGEVQVDVRLHDESMWLSQSAMAELFQTTQQNISQHILNIFDEGELTESATNKKFLLVRKEGDRAVEREIDHYNLDMIISVGYRVKSLIATRFRIWATQRLREYIVKGFVMDDERLKNPPEKGSVIPDYFAEMLARIRDIRSSERRLYLRVREIFAMAADYEPTAADTSKFFSIIQNKLHFAATGLTAAEIISSRANSRDPNMGLTTWKADDIRKSDVTIAKNYLNENEIGELNRIVTMWLDFAEDQALRRKQVFMKDWEARLDDFLQFNDRRVLPNAGTVSKEAAKKHAKAEFDQFALMRREQRELSGEKDYLKQLEAAAKELPTSKTKEA